MKHEGLPEKFTRLGLGADGREYVQCTRTGDVLVRTGEDEWGHFATADEWRSRTAPQLYPTLIHLTRALKEIGRYEEVERQEASIDEATALLDELRESLARRRADLRTAHIQEPALAGG